MRGTDGVGRVAHVLNHLMKWGCVVLLMLVIGNCLAQRQGETVAAPSRLASDRAGEPLPRIFTNGVAAIKAKTHIPILLPRHLGQPLEKAKYAVVQDANANEYFISLYYKLHVGDAGFAGSFSAEAEPRYNVGDLENVSVVKLTHGLRGFFRAVSCGGSCAPANLWWEQSGIMYQIQIKLPPTLSEESQQKAVVSLADSSITAGPR